MRLGNHIVVKEQQAKDHNPLLRYRLLQRIGKSGMAEVFIARDTNCSEKGLKVAFKRFLPEVTRDQEVMAILFKEAESGLQLKYPSIAALQTFGQVGPIHFIVSELVEGIDIRQLSKRLNSNDRRLPIPAALHIAISIGEALDYAHRQGVVHTNLIPENVRLRTDGLVKVTDFGIGRAANFLLEGRTRILKRRYGYMSPEQVRGQTADHRADIFALGSILYELLTGTPTFAAENELATLDRVRTGDIVHPRNLRTEIREALQSTLLKALAPNISERWNTARELLRELRKQQLEIAADFSSGELGAWVEFAR